MTVTAAVSGCWHTSRPPRTLLQQGPAMGSTQRLSRLRPRQTHLWGHLGQHRPCPGRVVPHRRLVPVLPPALAMRAGHIATCCRLRSVDTMRTAKVGTGAPKLNLQSLKFHIKYCRNGVFWVVACFALSVLIPTADQDIWEKQGGSIKGHLRRKTEILPVLANSADSPGVSEGSTSNVRFCHFFIFSPVRAFPLRAKL